MFLAYGKSNPTTQKEPEDQEILEHKPKMNRRSSLANQNPNPSFFPFSLGIKIFLSKHFPPNVSRQLSKSINL